MKLRSAKIAIMFAAGALMMPALLSAQFTSYVGAPKKAAVDSTKPQTVAGAKARTDTVSRMTLSGMKAWVDSAAGTSKPAAIADTAVVVTTAVPETSSTPVHATTTFSNGAIAPNTASDVPATLAIGLGLFAAGVLLFRLRRRRV